MKIDRHNYEEYFILYMDNELSPEERRMVEVFVQQHPDLKEELDLLLQFKLTPDTSVIYPCKEELVKINGDTPVTAANYEEWLVLYLDNELTPGQRQSVEQFITANPAVKKEMDLLLKTKLYPEEISFRYKESLYRKEEKVRVIRWRSVAAAILILAAGTTAVFVFTNKSSTGKNNIAKSGSNPGRKTGPGNINGQPNTGNHSAVPKESTLPADEKIADNTVKKSYTPATKQDNKNSTVKTNKIIVKDKLPVIIPAPVKKEEIAIASNNNPSNNLPQPLNNPNINKSDASISGSASVTIPKEIAAPSASLTTQPVTNAITASYNNNNGTAEPLEEGGKNKKNRGFFRKLTRTFEKRTNINATDDDRLLVGGLAIKLK